MKTKSADDPQKIAKRERAHHDLVASKYDQWFVEPLQYQLLNREFCDQITKTLECPRGLLLEIGAGTGVLSVPLSESGYHVIAMDISFEMIANIRRKNKEVPLFQGDALHLPIRSNSVATIIISESLHHLPRRKYFFEELRRILDKDGIVFIFEPQELVIGLDWVRRILRAALCPGDHIEDEEPIKRNEVLTDLNRLGFSILSISTTFFFPFSPKKKWLRKVVETIWFWPSKVPLLNRLGGVLKIVAKKEYPAS